MEAGVSVYMGINSLENVFPDIISSKASLSSQAEPSNVKQESKDHEYCTAAGLEPGHVENSVDALISTSSDGAKMTLLRGAKMRVGLAASSARRLRMEEKPDTPRKFVAFA